MDLIYNPSQTIKPPFNHYLIWIQVYALFEMVVSTLPWKNKIELANINERGYKTNNAEDAT